MEVPLPQQSFFFWYRLTYMCEGVTRGQPRPIDLKSSFILSLSLSLNSLMAVKWCTKLNVVTDLHTQIGNATRLGERRPVRFCYANEHISVHCPSFGSLPICPDRLRLTSWLTIPTETGLGQLSQGSRYGSHHAPFHAFLETSWRIGNETLSSL